MGFAYNPFTNNFDNVGGETSSGGTSTTNNFNDKYIDQAGGGTHPHGTLSGLVNGSNNLYTVSQGRYTTGKLDVFLNGQRQTIGSTGDVTETTPASGTFTFAIAPLTGSIITAVYTTISSTTNSLVKAIATNNAQKVIVNTAAETSVIPTLNGSLTLPANFWTTGKILNFTAAGTYQTPAVGGAGVTVRLKVGTTVLASATVPSTVLSSNSTISRFAGTGQIVCVSTGASGSVYIDANLRFQTNATVTVDVPLHNAGAASTLDTTSAGLFDITAQWGSANAAQGTTTNAITVKVENGA